MKTNLFLTSTKFAKNIRIVLFVLTLAMFVFAAGAPECIGTVGHQFTRMVLVIAVFIGLIAGLVRAWVGKREYRFYELNAPFLVLVAFLPQIITFFLPSIKNGVPDKYAPIVLVSTQAILFLFAVLNIKKISFWPISLGFLANFVVIVLNGGLMPISPETIRRLVPNAPAEWLVTGQRLGTGKDIVLNTKDTILPIF